MIVITRKPRIAGAASAALAAVLIAGCGGTSASSTSGNGSSGSGGASGSALVKQAHQEFSNYLSQPAFKAPGPPVDATKVKGRTLLLVAHDQVSDLLVGVAQGAREAGAAAGLQVSIFNGQGQASTIQQGIEQGIKQKVGAILLDGVAADLVPSALQQANAAHIPVIGLTIGLPSEGGAGKGVNAASAGDNNLMGELMADTAITHSGGKVNAIVETFNNPDSAGVLTGIKKAFSHCPTCKIVASANVEPPDWPTKLATTTSSLVRAHPEANFVMPTADTMGIFATVGVKQAAAASRVKVVSADGSGPGPLNLVKAGDVFIADPGVSADWLGWEGADQALRLMTGMPAGNPVVPLRYLYPENLGSVNVKDGTALYGNGYQAALKKLWGVS